LDETVAGLSDKFKLKSVRLYNTCNKGRIVPRTDDNTWINNHIALKASVPLTAAKQFGPLLYDDATDFSTPGTPDIAMKGAIYTFETQAATGNRGDATCVVVGGYYDTDSHETYYRLDFLESDGTSFRDILRNHQYIVNIKSVKGRGHATPQEAFESKSVNMTVEILDWDEGGMGHIVFDGQFVLSVSQDEYTFSRDARTGNQGDNVLYVFTDYATTAPSPAQSGWYVEKITDAAGTPVDWLTLTPALGVENNKTTVVFTFGENNTSAERSATVWIAAGRLRYPVTVTQSLTPDIGLSILDWASKPITELVFTSAVDVVPVPQVFTVNWAPQTSILKEAVYQIHAVPFPVSGITPTIGNVAAGGGPVSYTVAPPAITTTEVAGDPFIEKAMRIEFMVSNGAVYESKMLFLRQINYHTMTNEAAYYILNGNSYNFYVKSNTSWVVGSYSDPNGILDFSASGSEAAFLAQSGGYDTNPGNKFAFKLITDPTGVKNGSLATVTFHDPTGKMTDVTATIKGITCGIDGTAIAQTIGNNEYLTHRYGSGASQRCWMVQNSKEGHYAETTYEGKKPGERGYYYAYRDAASACPPGWHLPSVQEAEDLMAEALKHDNELNSIGRWWWGYLAGFGDAFGGDYDHANKGWYNWDLIGLWWYDTPTPGIRTYFAGFERGMRKESSSGPNDLLTVRCVQDYNK
jgi:uncharacterized protein (TIGR02145 family)